MRVPEPPAVVRGLSAEQAQQTAADFFARFPFEPEAPGPDTLSAAEFLAFL